MSETVYSVERDESGLAVPPPENRRPSNERRMELLDRLDYKVEAVLELQENIYELRDERDPEKIHEALADIWSKTTMIFPPATISQYEQLQETEEQLKSVHQENSLWVEQTTEQQEFLHRRQKKLRSEATELMKNEDIQFLMNIGHVVNDLAHKFITLESIRGQPEKIIEQVNGYMSTGKLAVKDVVEMRTMPFEITLILTPQAFNRIRGYGTSGVHFNNSPFSLARQEPDVEKTIRHESVHNIIDRAGGIGSSGYGLDKKLISEYKLAKFTVDRSTIEDRLTRTDPEYLLNSMHNELLAELANWEERPSIKNPNIIERAAAKNTPFTFNADRFSTAGKEAADIDNIFFQIGRQCKDPGTKVRLQAIRQEFRNGFVQTIEHMKNAIARTRSIGEEADDRLHALLFVLPPSRYRHLEHYLDFKYDQNFSPDQST